MEVIKKLLALREVTLSRSLQTNVYLEDLCAIVVVELPVNITKPDLDAIFLSLDEELIKQKLTLRDTYVLDDIGSFYFRVNYPLT